MDSERPRRTPDHIALEELSEEERHLLMESDSFCIIPWTHLHAHPDGRAFPCCLADMDYPLGSLKEQSITTLWNNDAFRQIRLDMLAGRKPPACHKCYERERSGFFSKRNSSNKQLGHHIEMIHQTGADGSMAKPHIVYLDIRFSNLCNLSCRSCSPLFSSSWYDDYVALAGTPPPHPKLMHVGRDPQDLWAQLEEHIPTLEKITFGGGEPLIMEEHYRLLKALDERRMYHVRLFYHTNLSTVRYKDVDVLALWNKFEEVHVGGSLDAMGPAAALMRHGTNWARIEENRTRMLERCPRVDFYLGPTLGLINSLHLPDFHRNWVERGLIGIDQISISVLQQPSWQRLDALPASLKRQVEDKYARHIEWMTAQGASAEVIDSYRNAITFMNSEDHTAELRKFVGYTRKLDELRREDTFAVFPELRPILDELAARSPEVNRT